MGPADLHRALAALEPETHPSLMVGPGTFDDAGVFRLDDATALIQTVDFFTPVVDDPRTFGAISAANSLSDVYAMGGRPITALAVVGVPADFDMAVLSQILAGGQAKAREAGVPILGGHTVKDPELKYGLAVTGVVHPERLVTSAGARPGDVLYLTKPIGTGVITTALKNGACPPDVLEGAVASMLRLNAEACEAMLEVGVHACTDVTGFGLAGHAHQLAHTSGVAIQLDPSALPILPGALEAAENGHIPGGLEANRSFNAEWFGLGSPDDAVTELLYDPQTSGGLLMAVPPQKADAMVDALQQHSLPVHAVGRVLEGRPGGLFIVT